MIVFLVIHLSLAFVPQICFPWNDQQAASPSSSNAGTFGNASSATGTFSYTSSTRMPVSSWALQLAPGDNVTLAPTRSHFESVAESWSVIFWMNDTTDYESSPSTNVSYRVVSTRASGANTHGLVVRRRRRAYDLMPLVELCVDDTTLPLSSVCKNQVNDGRIVPGQWARVRLTATKQGWLFRSRFVLAIDDVPMVVVLTSSEESFASHGADLTFGGATSGGEQGALQLDDVIVLFDELATAETVNSYVCGASGLPPTTQPTLTPTHPPSTSPVAPPTAPIATPTSPPPAPSQAATTANDDVAVIVIAIGVSLACCVSITLLGSFFVAHRQRAHRRRAAPPASRRTTAPASRATSAVYRVATSSASRGASTRASRRQSTALVNREYAIVLPITGSSSGGSINIGGSGKNAATAGLVNTYDVVGGGKPRATASAADYDATSIPIETVYDASTAPI